MLAVPGSPLDPRSIGTNQLIRDGATLITSAQDVIEAVNPLDPDLFEFNAPVTLNALDFELTGEIPKDIADDARTKILQMLGPNPITPDDVIHFTGHTPGEVQLTLLELELGREIWKDIPVV